MADSIFGRLGALVRAEINARFDDDDSAPAPRAATRRATVAERPKVAIHDVKAAYRALDLDPADHPDLAEVRAAYFKKAQRIHPRTQSERSDQAVAADTLLSALTDALEMLEEHLLPLPDRPQA